MAQKYGLVGFIMCIFCFSNLSLAEEISQKDFKLSENYYKKTISYGSKGNFTKAEEQIRKSLEINKFNQTSASVLKIIEDFKDGTISQEYIKCLFVSFYYSNRKSFDQAIKKLREAIQINPNYSSAYYNLGLLHMLRGDTQQAILHYKKATEINPSAEAYHGLASAYGYAKQHQEAITCSQKSLEIDPNYALSYFNLGVSYWSLKQYGKAKANLQKAKELFEQQDNDNDAKGVALQLERLKYISN